MSHVNAKSELNQFLQAVLGRPVTKQDLTFETTHFPGEGHQSLLTIHALNGEAYHGELGQNAKEAEQLAAQQALNMHAAEIAQLGNQPKRGTKRPATVGHVAGTGVTSALAMAQAAMAALRPAPMSPFALMPALGKGKGKAKGGGNPFAGMLGASVAPARVGVPNLGGKAPASAATPSLQRTKAPQPEVAPKMQLNALVLKILRRSLAKGEIAYVSNEVEDGQIQATVTLPELPVVGVLEFNGHPLRSASEAENSAAEIAFQSLQEDPELQQVLASLPSKKKKSAEGVSSPLSPGFGAPVQKEMSAKERLNMLVLKIVRRHLSKGEIAYSTVEVEDGQRQATVRLPELPGVGATEFNGHSMGLAADAENSAAEFAVQFIEGDPGLQEVLASLKQKKPASSAAAMAMVSPLSPSLPPPNLAFKGLLGKGPQGGNCKIVDGIITMPPSAKRAKVEPGSGPPPALRATARVAQEPKIRLNALVMKMVRRSLAKGEIVYEVNEVEDGQRQATVTLPELPGVGVLEFNGHVVATDKEAEKSAAEVAAQSIEEDPELQPLLAAQPQKRKAAAPGEAAAGAQGSPKSELNMLVLKIVRRVLTKGEIAYGTTQLEDGRFQATVSLPELPGVGVMEFDGQPLGSAAEAENSVAQIAAQFILEEPELQQLAAAEKKPAQGAAPRAVLPTPKSKGNAAKGAGKGAGKAGTSKGGRGGKGKANLERTRVLDRCTGVIDEWKGSFGWIMSDTPVEHEKAELHGGRIYVHSRDCGGNVMAKDQEVAFDVYEDATGLGAEDVDPL